MTDSMIPAMLMASAAMAPGAVPSDPQLARVAGSWALVAADLVRPDGSVIHDYGDAPHGRLLIDGEGNYSLQIFNAQRQLFAGGSKAAGSDSEFRSAAMGSSTHYGRIRFDGDQITFYITGASFPNWEGTIQRRTYELSDDELRYRVAPRPDGGVPISVWRRLR